MLAPYRGLSPTLSSAPSRVNASTQSARVRRNEALMRRARDRGVIPASGGNGRLHALSATGSALPHPLPK